MIINSITIHKNPAKFAFSLLRSHLLSLSLHPRLPGKIPYQMGSSIGLGPLESHAKPLERKVMQQAANTIRIGTPHYDGQTSQCAFAAWRPCVRLKNPATRYQRPTKRSALTKRSVLAKRSAHRRNPSPTYLIHSKLIEQGNAKVILPHGIQE